MAKRLHLAIRQTELWHYSSDLVRDITHEPMKPNEREVLSRLGGEKRKQAIAHQVVKSRTNDGVINQRAGQ